MRPPQTALVVATFAGLIAWIGWLVSTPYRRDEAKVRVQREAFVLRMQIDPKSVGCDDRWPRDCSAVTTSGYPLKFVCGEESCTIVRW